MKKLLIIIGILIAAGISLFVFSHESPYKTERVCFGDVCPDNGGVYLLYKFLYTKEQCLAKGAYPVEGFGWTPVYAGCSPIDHKLSR